MELMVKINNQTVGRDKLARFIQYSSRALWYFIQQYQLSGSKSIEKIKRLENVFSTFRKLLRLGRFVESFYSATQSIQSSNKMLKFTTTLSKLAFGMYLFCDHVICLEKTGLMEIQSQKWYMMSSQYWLTALLPLVIRDLYELIRIFTAIKEQPVGSMCHTVYSNHKDVLIDTAKNLCDVLIPVTALGYVNLSPGTIGLAGAISSILGLIPLIQPLFKLKAL